MHRRYIIALLILAMSIAMSGCVDPISLELPGGNQKLVIFGWITTAEVPYQVSISASKDFNDQTSFEPESGATVFVLDSNGQSFDFIEQSGTGNYFSDPSTFVGEVGNTYELHVTTTNGEQYVSKVEALKNLPPIDTVFVNFIIDPEVFVVLDTDNNFFLTGFIDDTPQKKNYYRWKIYVNGELRNAPTDLTLFDDEFTDGNTFRHDANNTAFKRNDKILLEHLSMSESAFEYFKLLKNQTENNQLGPRPIPATLVGNMTNERNPDEAVLGYFGASQIELIAVN